MHIFSKKPWFDYKIQWTRVLIKSGFPRHFMTIEIFKAQQCQWKNRKNSVALLLFEPCKSLTYINHHRRCGFLSLCKYHHSLWSQQDENALLHHQENISPFLLSSPIFALLLLNHLFAALDPGGGGMEKMIDRGKWQLLSQISSHHACCSSSWICKKCLQIVSRIWLLANLVFSPKWKQAQIL